MIRFRRQSEIKTMRCHRIPADDIHRFVGHQRLECLYFTILSIIYDLNGLPQREIYVYYPGPYGCLADKKCLINPEIRPTSNPTNTNLAQYKMYCDCNIYGQLIDNKEFTYEFRLYRTGAPRQGRCRQAA